MSPKYYISPNVYLRDCHYHWVFLDVIRDRYLCVPRREFEILVPWLVLDETCPTDVSEARSGPDASRIPDRVEKHALPLLSEGLITADPTTVGHTRPPCSHLNPPSNSLSDTSDIKPRLKDLARFSSSTVKADYFLRNKPISTVVDRVYARRIRNQDSDFDFSLTRERVAIYNRLRWFYPRDYLCLFECLALLELLAEDYLYPKWVFGVTTDPFKAHCWLQHGEVVVNDSLERVTAYLPIMAV